MLSKLTEEAVRSGDKIDSLEVTIALEIVSHFRDGSGGLKNGKTQVWHHTYENNTRSILCNKNNSFTAGGRFCKYVLLQMSGSELLMLSIVPLLTHNSTWPEHVDYYIDFVDKIF